MSPTRIIQYTYRFAGAPRARASALARSRAVRQGYPATPGLLSDTSDIQRYSAIFSDTSDTRATRLRQGYPILPVPAILRVLR